MPYKLKTCLALIPFQNDRLLEIEEKCYHFHTLPTHTHGNRYNFIILKSIRQSVKCRGGGALAGTCSTERLGPLSPTYNVHVYTVVGGASLVAHFIYIAFKKKRCTFKKIYSPTAP